MLNGKFLSCGLAAVLTLVCASTAMASDRDNRHDRNSRNERNHYDRDRYDRSDRWDRGRSDRDRGSHIDFGISIIIGDRGRPCPPPVYRPAPPCPPPVYRPEPPCPPPVYRPAPLPCPPERVIPQPIYVEIEEIEEVPVPVYQVSYDHCGRRREVYLYTRIDTRVVRRTVRACWDERLGCYTYTDRKGNLCHYRR